MAFFFFFFFFFLNNLDQHLVRDDVLNSYILILH